MPGWSSVVALLWLLVSIGTPLSAMATGAAPALALRSQVAPTHFPVRVSPDDRRWLLAQNELVIGLWGEDWAPIQFRPDDGSVAGVAADHLVLLGNALGVPVRARWFADRAAALRALRAQEVTAISAFADPVDEADLDATAPYLQAPLAVVRRGGPALAEGGALEGRGVFVALQAEARALLSSHPDARQVSARPSLFAALEAVSLGHADYYVGDLVSASHAVEQGLFLNLRIARIEQDTTCFGFITLASRPEAKRVLGQGLNAIAPWMRQSILRNWAAGAAQDMDASNRLAFTDDEQAWIDTHPVVRVAVDTTHAPYTFIDSRGEFAGVYADLLKVIGRRTGLRFEVIPRTSSYGLDAALHPARTDMAALLVPNAAPGGSLALSNEVVPVVWVLVAPRTGSGISTLASLRGKRLALVRGGGMTEWLQARYPQIELLPMDSATDALDLVARGDADASLQTLASASYAIERYFDQLHIAGSVFGRPQVARFGVDAAHPQLLAILNRTLDAMSPAERASIASRWLANINYPSSTWQSLRRSVSRWLPWLVGGLALVLGWNSLLQYQIRRRRQAEREWRAAKQAAERASSEKSAFLAEMSHEIRTPMNAVIGLLEMANRRRAAGMDDAESLLLAEASAKDLLDLVGNLLDLGKIEAGELCLAPRAISLHALIAGSIALFAPAAERKGIVLTHAIDAAVPDGIRADPLRLRQVLGNLLGNAVKFTTQGQIVLEARLHEGRLCIRVCDTGRGIAAADLATIFEPFRQSDTPSASMGTGLGLSIVRRLVTLMDGAVTLQSSEGNGTQVTVELPLVAATLGQAVQDDLLFARRRSRVLVVDDNPINLRVVTDQLEWLGYQVTQASDGIAALQVLQGPVSVDLVLTDCSMPRMSGAMLATAIRRDERDRALPRRVIIGHTANALPEARTESLAAGMDDVLVKPMGVAQLSAVLARWIAPGDVHAADAQRPQPAPAEVPGLLQSVEADLHALAQAMRGQRWQQVADVAHRLRGAVACTSPAEDVDQACLVLELCAARDATRDVAVLQGHHARLVERMAVWCAEHGHTRPALSNPFDVRQGGAAAKYTSSAGNAALPPHQERDTP